MYICRLHLLPPYIRGLRLLFLSIFLIALSLVVNFRTPKMVSQIESLKDLITKAIIRIPQVFNMTHRV
jgi:hypothetical protein